MRCRAVIVLVDNVTTGKYFALLVTLQRWKDTEISQLTNQNKVN